MNKQHPKQYGGIGLYIGLMSGTSLDGIDASIIETDGDRFLSTLNNLHLPYEKKFVEQLKKVISTQQNFLETENELSRLHAEIVNELLASSNLSPENITAIGFHGQTIHHDPQNEISWQIGNPHLLAQITGIDVVNDFRRRDVAAGGEGAPLIPIYHKCMADGSTKPTMILNIGGVANITYIGEQNEIVAFDTGPGNALIDDVMQKEFNLPFDKDGTIAASGKVQQDALDTWLQDEYFNLLYPKSLDRNHFQKLINHSIISEPKDLVATLTAFTVQSILAGLSMLPSGPQEIYVCGGGFKNRQMMKLLDEQISVKRIADLGDYDSEYIESQGFAYLAARYINGLPSTFPTSTGVRKPTLAGVLVRAV